MANYGYIFISQVVVAICCSGRAIWAKEDYKEPNLLLWSLAYT